jgi:hypothetical protein
VSFDYVFPAGAMLVAVEPVRDFEGKDSGGGDSQARDKETGQRLWQVTVIDNDEEAARFGRSPAVKVKIAASVSPVAPAAQVPGFRPLVAFEGLTLTPYVDQGRCKPAGRGGSYRCGARQAYALRATAMVAPTTLPAGTGRVG